MANIIYINDLRPNLDPTFIRTPVGFVADDSTSRPVLGLGQKLELDMPPLTAGEYGRIRASIEGTGEYDDVQEGIGTSSVYNHYSNIDKGQIQYYMDTDFINPFQPFFKDTNHISTKQILPDRTIEYLRQPIVPISRSSSLNPVYDEQLQKLENPYLNHGFPLGKGPLQYGSAFVRMGESEGGIFNKLNSPNQWVVDTQNQREDIQALQMRTMIRQNYTPAEMY
ncbi:hypothetical protein IIV31_189R [Armadillidium vulgare iridescent virus]|jgi:hypothetical protein|uniref:Uncharacterized protein n=1 Tax=Armadillidium vulgare iridescent virus TaxID=72201 RepID=A0A068QKT0_9VIRU|nr:hypothetical protein IIV31_189R [Armadillidium vulgare iridescent virus]CCV02561.1 hypothetical protein IIV31_189R [Armadillidium vulgare iridescent virus]